MNRISGFNILRTTTTKLVSSQKQNAFIKRTSATSSKKNSFDTTSVRLYRILMKVCNRMLPDETFLLQPPLNPRDYGQATIMRATTATPNKERALAILKFFEETEMHRGDRSRKSAEEDGDEISNAPASVWAELAGLLDAKGGDTKDSSKRDPSIFVFPSDVKKAVRKGFIRSSLVHDDAFVIQWHKYAIDAVSLLQQQIQMMERTSVSIDESRGLKVVATSRCIGSTNYGSNVVAGTKHRFAYRIRVENIAPPEDEHPHAWQLLGRTWEIKEENKDGGQGEVVTVDAPTTGAVGILPVIRPGYVFQYMSGCELGTHTGTMSGFFHMAEVDKESDSTLVGERTPSFRLPANKKFKMPVEPFRLIADA